MKILSEEHKKKIGEATKRMWERGDFNSETIRNKWRETALSGIAKKGRKSPNKFIPSQEMIDDYSKMGDKDLSNKYDVSVALVVRTRKRYSLPRFNNQHNLIPHKIENGKEYKWCGSGHWEVIELFGKHTSRYDGLRGNCKFHSNEIRVKSYDRTDGARKAREYVKTEKGKSSRRATMRKVWAKRRGCYVKFDLKDEQNIYNLFNQSCAYCKIPVGFDELEFDHFIPVKKGGKTEPSNMLPSCPTCNRGKGGKRDKDPHQWLIERFGEYYGEQIYQDCVSVLQSL